LVEQGRPSRFEEDFPPFDQGSSGRWRRLQRGEEEDVVEGAIRSLSAIRIGDRGVTVTQGVTTRSRGRGNGDRTDKGEEEEEERGRPTQRGNEGGRERDSSADFGSTLSGGESTSDGERGDGTAPAPARRTIRDLLASGPRLIPAEAPYVTYTRSQVFGRSSITGLPLAPYIPSTRTQVFGRNNATGLPVGPKGEVVEGESGSERLERMDKYENWNHLCRFVVAGTDLPNSKQQLTLRWVRYLNECRRFRRLGQGFQPDDLLDEPHVTPEDFVYQAYLTKNTERRTHILRELGQEDACFLAQRRIALNTESRRKWAIDICGGHLRSPPRILQGHYSVEYLVYEENKVPERESKFDLRLSCR